MPTIARVYKPREEDLLALQHETTGCLEEVPSEVQKLVVAYHRHYLPYLLGDWKSSCVKLGEGSIGEVHLFSPADGTQPFVRKRFKGGETRLLHKGLSIPQMNFMIDLRVMRALGDVLIGPKLYACSFASNELITSYERGDMVSSSTSVPEIHRTDIWAMICDMVALYNKGVVIDNNPSNMLYDKGDGFSLIDALPSSRLIEEDGDGFEELRGAVTQATDAFLEDDSAHHALFAASSLDVRRNVYDQPLSEHLFSATKTIAYALIAKLPDGAHLNSSDHYLHDTEFQRIFLRCLHQVMGILKKDVPGAFAAFSERVKLHLANLKKGCSVGTGWNAGAVNYYDVAPGKAIADDPVVSARIKEIQAL